MFEVSVSLTRWKCILFEYCAVNVYVRRDIILWQVWTWYLPQFHHAMFKSCLNQQLATKSSFMQSKFWNFDVYWFLAQLLSTFLESAQNLRISANHLMFPWTAFSGYFAQGELQFIIQFDTWETWLLDFAICTACDNHWLFQPFPQGLKVRILARKWI